MNYTNVAPRPAQLARNSAHRIASALIFSGAMFFLVFPVVAQKNANLLNDKLEVVVNSQFKASNCPGLTVVAASKNRIVFSKALGNADIEQGVPLATNSVHRLGSLSKPITGTIIMDLVEQGKLSLDTSVRQYLPELPESYQKVTLRHLLTHQSGVRGYANAETVAFSGIHYATSREVLKTFMDYPLSFEPGTKSEYASLSFTVLGAAAEAVTGHTFQQLSSDFFARHRISGISLDDPLAVVPRRVRGYLVDPASRITFSDGRVVTRDYLAGTPGEITNARAYDISNRYPAGGFVSSGEDLLRFVTAIASGQILKPDSVSKMWSAQSTSNGTKSPFGLGWGVSQWNGHVMVGLNGAEPSTTTFLRYFPDSGSGVAMFCNAEGAQNLPKLLNDILETVEGGKP
jgi:CubicO group peptidase (beta-lactamase class C family)